jgi:hypothetical protein
MFSKKKKKRENNRKIINKYPETRFKQEFL